MATLSLIIDWCGPFPSIVRANEAANNFNLREVLYLATGQRAYQRKGTMQYVGISNDPKSRFNGNHHTLPEIKRNFGIWIGEIVSHGIAGRRAHNQPVMHSLAVERAEWAIAYFLALPLNQRKRRKPPPGAIILINRWFQTDFETRRNHRGHHDWPDFIEFEPDYDVARLQWFGAPGRMKRYNESEIRSLAIEPNSN
jgi:hypothetical protein